VVASSPDGGAVFTVADAPCKGLLAAITSMKPQESVRLLLKPECECNRRGQGGGCLMHLARSAGCSIQA
jgi:hypothetical protein